MNDLTTIAHNLRTQDNRITANPIFMVQVKVSHLGTPDNDDPHYWVNNDWERVDDDISKLLDEAEESGLNEWVHPDEPDRKRYLKGYTKVHYVDVYQHHMPFFTEHGANEYLKINKHNLREPRIYVESGYRNAEWELVRQHLMGAPREGWKS